jgi:hypothetical protein
MFNNVSSDSSVNRQDEVAFSRENDPFFTQEPEKPPAVLEPKAEYFPDYDKQRRERGVSFSSPNYVWTVYKKRWANAFAFFGLNFIQCMATICISAFLTPLGKAYGIGEFESNMATSASAALFLPSFIMATQMYNTWSLRTVLFICSIMIVIGAWMRMLTAITGNFWFIIVGQSIIGISSPITTGGVSIVANYWFADHERA